MDWPGLCIHSEVERASFIYLYICMKYVYSIKYIY